MKVLVTEKIAEEGIQRLQKEFTVDTRLDLSPEDLLKTIHQYHALITRSQTKVTADVIRAGKNLKVIARAGAGVDNIDVEAATENGVLVVNAADGNTIAAAEHAFGLMLALARHIPQANNSLKAGEWQRSKFLGVELYGKTLGIIGLGRIGGEVAKRAKAFQMEVLAYDPYVAQERAAQLGARLVGIDELLEKADFITIHAPKTDAILGEKELAKVKPGVRIVNVARGGLIDNQALIEAIQAGRVAGAAVDVYVKEPPVDDPITKQDKVIATPHLGASTVEAQYNVALAVAEQVEKILKGIPLATAVNLPSLPPEEVYALAPYIPLAELLGYFYAKAFPGEVKHIEVRYEGDLASHPTALLTNSALKGLLRGFLSDPVNHVNARLVARERGIEISESKQLNSKSSPSIKLKVSSSRGTRVLAGTLSADGEPRIINLDDHRIDMPPSPYMIVAYHIDKPGIIGKVGSVLGSRNINIAGMQVGRRTVGGHEVMIVQIDSPLDEEGMTMLRNTEGILSLRFVEIPKALIAKFGQSQT